MTTATASKYTADEITALEGLEPVRKRPSMYIGGVDSKGLHHLVWEIVDNAVDEYLNGYADSHHRHAAQAGDAVTISDNGRGIPVDIASQVQTAGARSDPHHAALRRQVRRGDNYVHSGGLHGVGSSVVNALSKKLVATIRRDGFEWEQTFRRGKPPARWKNLDHFAATAPPSTSSPIRKSSRPSHLTPTDPRPSGGHVVYPQRLEDHLQERRCRRKL